jgi:hypothetical protein
MRTSATSAGATPPVGVFGLAIGTLLHPIRTMDAFFYYVNDTSMLVKMGLFYLLSLPLAGLIAAEGQASRWGIGTVGEAAGFAVGVLCIAGAGKLLGQSFSIVGAAVILGFVRAVVTLVLGPYALAVGMEFLEPNLFILLVFAVWMVVLNIMALTNIFGCSAAFAFLISLIANGLHRYVTQAIGVGG